MLCAGEILLYNKGCPMTPLSLKKNYREYVLILTKTPKILSGHPLMESLAKDFFYFHFLFSANSYCYYFANILMLILGDIPNFNVNFR